MNIGQYTFGEFKARAAEYHGYPAPGLLIGGYMVEAAKARLEPGTLFETLCESPKCLPDAVQLLTVCTTGNGRLHILNLGRYAVTLFDKFTFAGFRAYVDSEKLATRPEIEAWFLKTKPKKEQDTERLFAEIEDAGDSIISVRPVQVRRRAGTAKTMRTITVCPVCKEAYPTEDGAVCRGCAGEDPYLPFADITESMSDAGPPLSAVDLENIAGKRALHDMTQIIPDKSKGPAVNAGDIITAGDICRLQYMGKSRIYTDESADDVNSDTWIHENDAAREFGRRMAGENVRVSEPPSEGKVTFFAECDGLFVSDMSRLKGFNIVPDVMCAARQCWSVVEKDRPLAGCRAIPLYLSRNRYADALEVLGTDPLFRVLPFRRPKVGVLVTGTEVFQGLIEDKFLPVITNKIHTFKGEISGSQIVPDDRTAVAEGVETLLQTGADMIITTAGLSVDPDDITRAGLLDAGLEDILYGFPVLPGAMLLLGRIDEVQVIGVPACALFYKTTSLDLILPRLLAGVKITRAQAAEIADGGFCLNCKSCTFPKCPFGK